MTNATRNILLHWREAVPNDRLAHLVRDAARAFHRALQVRLAQHGVPFGHWTFLRILWESDGLTQRELSERAGVMEPTTFVAMKAMEALGYIVRRHLPPNKKNVYVYLSHKGRALKKVLVPMAVDANKVGLLGIAADEIKTTRRVLLAMIENLAREEPLQTAPMNRRTGRLKPAAERATVGKERGSVKARAAGKTGVAAKPGTTGKTRKVAAYGRAVA